MGAGHLEGGLASGDRSQRRESRTSIPWKTMLVTKNRVNFLGIQEDRWENPHYIIYWSGFVFLPEIDPGIASIKKLAQQITKSGIQAGSNNLLGNYFILVQDKIRNNAYAFIDNCGIFRAFYSANAISTSFWDLMRFESLSKSQLNREVVVEFINFGSIFFHKTFFDAIGKIPSDRILSFSASGRVTFLNKGLPEVEDATTDFLEFFEQLSSSIKNETLSVDLTGGIDSRLVAVLLDHFGLDFEVSVVGGLGDRDVKIATKVAEKLNHKLDVLHVTYQSPNEMEKQLNTLLLVSDGYCDLFRNYNLLQHHKARANRGVTLALAATGGELYKDFWWLQDFPFYRKSNSNIERLYDLRINPIPFDDSYLTCEYVDISQNLKRRRLDQLAEFVLDINTRTYDNIYFKYKMQELAGEGVTICSNLPGCKKYVPLLEFELVGYGFKLPRKQRFFNNFHRRMITELNPNVAKIETTEGGMSVSSQKRVRDLFRYVANRGVRVSRKIGQKFLKTDYFQEGGDRGRFHDQVRRLHSTHEAIELLKDEDIIKRDLRIAAVKDRHLGHLVSLGLFLKYMESTSTSGSLLSDSK